MLNRRVSKFRSDEGGFTLIELLVVILIIGILAAIALPTFLSQADKGRDATAQSDLRAAASKVTACVTEVGAANVANCTGTSMIGSKLTATTNATTGGFVLTASTAQYNTKTAWTLTSDGNQIGAPAKS